MKWTWKVKRKMSPLFADLFIKGLNGNAFEEIIPFLSKSQLIISNHENLSDIYYKKKEINRFYENVIKITKNNNHFVEQFEKISKKIFEKLNKITLNISNQDLSKINDKEIRELFEKFVKSFTAGPIITIQLFGIEALSKEFSDKRLHISSKETSLFKIRKKILEILLLIRNNNKSKEKIKEFLDKYFWIDPQLMGKLPEKSTNNRITAYLDKIIKVEKLSFEKLVLILFEELKKKGEKKYKEHLLYFQKLQSERRKAEKNHPNKKSKQIISALDCLIQQRDYSKQEYVKALFALNLLLIEISKRKNVSLKDLSYYSAYEVKKLLNENLKLKTAKINERKKGWGIISKNGMQRIVEGNMLSSLKKNININYNTKILKGKIVSKGKAKGKVRVITTSEDISNFQNGEILVANSTNLQMQSLFTKAAGIIVDEGGITSHAAIFAREFQVPCIIGTTFATKRLTTGQEVEINDKKEEIIIKD